MFFVEDIAVVLASYIITFLYIYLNYHTPYGIAIHLLVFVDAKEFHQNFMVRRYRFFFLSKFWFLFVCDEEKINKVLFNLYLVRQI